MRGLRAIAMAAAAGMLLPVPGAVAAVPSAAEAAAPPATVASASVASGQHGRKQVKRAVERFKVVPWRDGRNRARLAAVLVVRYPKARKTLPAKTRLMGKLYLKVGRPGHVLVRARDVARVLVWRPGARPRAVHVLKFSARQSRRLARHGVVRGWGARPPDWYAGISLTLAADSGPVASVMGWLPLPNPIDWAKEQWAKRDAACREPLPPEDRWTDDDHSAYLHCAVIWIVEIVDQGVPPHLQRPDSAPFIGDFVQCRPAMRDSLYSWTLEVERWDAEFTLRYWSLERQKYVTVATLPMTARRYGRGSTYELHGATWRAYQSEFEGLLPMTMSVTDSEPPVVKFVRNCPWR